MEIDVVQQILSFQFQFWIGALGLIFPLWMTKRLVFDS